MTNTHILTVSIADTEIEVQVEFTCSPYIPEQGPSFSSGGQPAEGGEVELGRGWVLIGKERAEAPCWLMDIISNDDDLMGDLAEAAAEDDEPDWDAINDARRDERMAAE